ncbi:sterol desaturase family protein [Xanthovirga aplysinae]|uniref:sterol desaturase family protein n=1 Tax=Xanthovirga aplysinae TaxID=2529853 RepID=UPI0012BCC987|nr:sterol desaturase family protein [Xanthovirga aplysinae]MTI31830.1 fatty acid hydroxylase [Xanthovirga aplysinae]
MGNGNSIMPKNKGSKVLFNNGFLEKLTKTHVAVPVTILGIYSTVLLYYAFSLYHLSIGIVIGFFLIGWFSFTLIEYLTHRYVFHMVANTDLRKKLQYTMHGVHHEFPKDKMRLAMPPILSLALGLLLLWIFNFIMGAYAWAFVPGFAVGYSMYLGVHYVVHAYPPPKNVLRKLWEHHAIHHYKDPERAFGVSSPLWDFLLGTMPRKSYH